MARIVAVGLGAALLALGSADATPAVGRTAARGAAFDPAAPAWARLTALHGAARELEAQPDATAAAKAAAWEALYAAASAVRVTPSGALHPLAGVALAAQASAQSERDMPGAVERWRRALAILQPYRDAYAPAYATTAAGLARGLSSILGKSTEALAVLGRSDIWFRDYLAKIPADRRSSADFDGETALLLAYGEVLSDLSRYPESIGYKRDYWQAMKRVRGPYYPETNAAQSNYAAELFQAGKSEEAEAEARAAVQTAIDHIKPTEVSVSQSFGTLAIILVRRGKRFEALDYIRRSIELRRAAITGDDPRIFASYYNLGDVLMALERYEGSSAALLEAGRGWQQAEGPGSVRAAIAKARAGMAEFGDGHTTAAAARIEAALAAARASDPKENRIGSLVQPVLNLAYYELGRSVDAKRLADENLAQLRTTPQPYPIEIAVAELTAAYVGNGPASAEARAAARRVIEIERSGRDIVAAGELVQGDRTAVDLALRVAAAANDAQLALDAMVVIAGSKIAQANRLVTDRLVGADPVLATRVRAQQDAARAFKTADSALLKAMAAGTGIAEARAKQAAAAGALATVRTALTRDYPAWSEASGVTDPDLAQVQRGLAPREAALAIVPAFDGVYTLLVTRTGAQVRRTPLGRRALTDLVAKLRGSLPAGPFDTQAAHELHRQFFPAADAGLLKGITSLRIVPAGVFAALPFATLLERPVRRLDGRAPYLIRRFAITIAPGIVPSPARPAVAAVDARFLGIGAPAGFGTQPSARLLAARSYFRGGTGNADALAALPALPGSGEEIARVARGFAPGRTQLLVGDDASEAKLKALDLKSYSTILFATHGLVSGEMEGLTEPALVLSRPRGTGDGDGDGLLTASEIAALTLDADWVILSACNTAAGEEVEAPAYSGLAQAFRYAGARTLLLSHWPIRDDAAAFVTVATIANARGGMRRDVALQQAMLKLMASRTIAGAGDPYVWAPYILLGETGG